MRLTSLNFKWFTLEPRSPDSELLFSEEVLSQIPPRFPGGCSHVWVLQTPRDNEVLWWRSAQRLASCAVLQTLYRKVQPITREKASWLSAFHAKVIFLITTKLISGFYNVRNRGCEESFLSARKQMAVVNSVFFCQGLYMLRNLQEILLFWIRISDLFYFKTEIETYI